MSKPDNKSEKPAPVPKEPKKEKTKWDIIVDGHVDTLKKLSKDNDGDACDQYMRKINEDIAVLKVQHDELVLFMKQKEVQFKHEQELRQLALDDLADTLKRHEQLLGTLAKVDTSKANRKRK